jgi:hypothetical protein
MVAVLPLFYLGWVLGFLKSSTVKFDQNCSEKYQQLLYQMRIVWKYSLWWFKYYNFYTMDADTFS